MEIKIVTGCICDSMTVDGIEEADMTDEQRKETLKKLGEFIATLGPENLNYILQSLEGWPLREGIVKSEVSKDACSSCGDHIYTTTITI